jgi:hypothetical protein
LEVTSEGVKTSIYLASGKPVFAEEGTLGETLGRILVRQRVLTEAQYASVIERMADFAEGTTPPRFGEVAVKLGYLTTEKVEDALAAQVRYKVMRCLQLEDPEHRFDPTPTRLRGIAHYPTTIEPLVLAATRTFDRARIDAVLKVGEHTFPRLRDPATEIARRFRLKTPEARFVASIDGKADMNALLASHQPDSVDVPAILAALVMTEELLLLAEPLSSPGLFWPSAPVRPDGSRPPDSLPPVLSPKLAEAPESAPIPPRPQPSVPAPRISRPPPGKSSVRPPSPADRQRAQRALERLRVARAPAPKEARPSKRPPANAHEARLLAEQAFQRGKMYVRSNQLGRALPDLRRAAELMPGATEYLLYRAWAEFRLANDPDGLVERTEELQRLALRAVKQDPTFAFGFYVAAHVAMIKEEYAIADQFFRRALKLDPESIDAERHVRILERRAKAPAPPKIRSRASKPEVAPSPPSETAPMTAVTAPATPSSGEMPAQSAKAIATPPASAPAIPRPAAPANETMTTATPAAAASASRANDPAVADATERMPGAPARPMPPMPMPPPPTTAPAVAVDRRRGSRARLGLAVLFGALVLGAAVAGLLLATGSKKSVTTSSNAASPATGAGSFAKSSVVAASESATSTAAIVVPPPRTAAPGPQASGAATATTSATPTATTAAPTPTPTPTPTATAKPSIPESMGEITTTGAPGGHRIFVDGRVMGETPGTVRVPCGAHTVKIGSGGKAQTVDVPCGAQVQVDKR